MRLRRLAVTLLGAVLLSSLATGAASASTTTIRSVDASEFPRVKITLSTPVTTSLTSGDVKVTENSNAVSAVTVQSLAQSGEEVAVVLAIDTSNSMKGEPLAAAITAAKTFLTQMPESVQVGVVTFADKPTLVQPIASDRAAAQSALEGLTTSGGTALYDGVVTSAEAFDNNGQRNIIVLSDGGNTTGEATLDSARQAATKADAAVFTVGLQSKATDETVLKSLAEGQSADLRGTYVPAGTSNLDQIYQSLAAQLSNQFLVSYTSAAQAGATLNVSVTAGGSTDSSAVLAPKAVASVHATPSVVQQSQPLLRGTWGLIVVVALVFLTIFVLVYFLLGTTHRMKRERDLAFRMRASQRVSDAPEQAGREGPMAWVPDPVLQAAGKAAEAGGFSEKLDDQLEKAGAPIRAGEFLTASVAGFVVGALFAAIVFANPIMILLLAALGAVAPWAVMKIAIRKRSAALHAQLADVLTILASSLRAGHSFMQALDTVAKEIPQPGADEFGRVVAEIRLGRPVEDALNAMAQRVGSDDFKWAVLAVNIQRQVGGNLAEILDTVSDTVRERDQIRRQVDVLTTEGRLSMYILTGLPLAIGIYMLVINRSYVSLLYSTRPGIIMLVGAGCLLVVGTIWMKRIVKIDV